MTATFTLDPDSGRILKRDALGNIVGGAPASNAPDSWRTAAGLPARFRTAAIVDGGSARSTSVPPTVSVLAASPIAAPSRPAAGSSVPARSVAAGVHARALQAAREAVPEPDALDVDDEHEDAAIERQAREDARRDLGGSPRSSGSVADEIHARATAIAGGAR